MTTGRLRFRFQHYLEKKEGHRILWMPRQDWRALQPHLGRPVQLDVLDTPLSEVLSRASVMAAIATRESTQSAQVDVYRYDPADHPTPVNKDSYIVLEDILGRPDYQDLVSAASTADTPELRGYLENNVGFVKADPGNDHWLPSLPASVVSVIKPST